MSPHLPVARESVIRWARSMGMLGAPDGTQAGAHGGGVWDERRLRVFDLAHCASMIHADATREQLQLSADWLCWGTYGDDYFPIVFGATRDLPAAKLCNDRLSLFMPVADGEPTPEPLNPLERGLADLWWRTVGPMSGSTRAALRTAVEDMTGSWLWELANQAANRIPDPVDYIEMRRRTFGSDMTMSLARLAHADVVPPDVYQTRVVRELVTAAQDYCCFLNDLFSYQKEIEFEGEVHNLVLVVENFLDIDRMAARDVVVDLTTERMRQFEQLTDDGLPRLFEELDLEPAVREALSREADQLKDWTAGILEWHRRCRRYAEDELRYHHGADAVRLPFLPTGPGTSAIGVPAAERTVPVAAS